MGYCQLLTQEPYKYEKDGNVLTRKCCVFHGDYKLLSLAKKLITPAYIEQFKNSDIKDPKELLEAITKGYACEIAFKYAIGQELPKALGHPDGGVDLTLDGITYDICCVGFYTDMVQIPKRKQEGKADYYVLISRENNYNKKTKEKDLNPPVSYIINGAISRDTIKNLQEGIMWNDADIKRLYPKFYASASKVNLAKKIPTIDPNVEWKKCKENNLFLPVKDTNGKTNMEIRFFNEDFPLVQSLVKLGLAKVV